MAILFKNIPISRVETLMELNQIHPFLTCVELILYKEKLRAIIKFMNDQQFILEVWPKNK